MAKERSVGLRSSRRASRSLVSGSAFANRASGRRCRRAVGLIRRSREALPFSWR
ncbi:hypothetical protein [Gordonibacter sp. An230]|uniref:hypothetical protein n=1 Tax=Gordonibacter sp. An230 TaxID=1965592 RepID=UPI0013A6131F|nr:hypothetical protein [Gordonibacter sp. An230]